jgi:hypothetical protein
MLMSIQGPRFNTGDTVFVGQQGHYVVSQRELGELSWEYTVVDANGEVMIWGETAWLDESQLRGEE